MGLFDFLNHWWNLPFLVMLGLVAVFFALQTFGLFGEGGDHDADASGPDQDVDHDVSADGGHDGDQDADADQDHDGEAGGASAWHGALAFLGVGRVPFMVVWVTLFLFTGFAGLIGNLLALDHGSDYPGWAFGIVLLVSFLIGVLAVRLFSRIAARFVDVGGKGATGKHELVGKVGVVASSQVDARFGEIRVRDSRGDEQLVHGRTKDAEGTLRHGAKVVIVDWDPKDELFWVTACPDLPGDSSADSSK